MRLTIHDNNNAAIDAHFSVEPHEDAITVVIESKGGGVSSPSLRNYDYDFGFLLILERLGSIGAILDSVVVDSQNTRRRNLSHEARLLRLPANYDYPISLATVDDLQKLSMVLCAAQKPIDQSPGARGGNGQRRIRLFIHPPTGSFDIATLQRNLSLFVNQSIYTESELSVAASEADAEGRFNPDDIEDARKRTMAAIVQREGQPRFRRELLEAYGNSCAITNCNIEDVLDAAHIFPFKGVLTNSAENGLLLRADIHILFDKGLIAIDTTTWKILINPRLENTEYGDLSQQTLRLPEQVRWQPSVEALCKHRINSNL